MLSVMNTAIYQGIEGRPVLVETDISSGLPFFNMVGLASKTVTESKDRIKSAIVNSGYDYPRGRITVNLAPAGFKKTGSHLDLPIALGILKCEGYLDNAKVAQYGILGELSLSGEVVSVDGVLPMIIAMSKNGIERVIVPTENYREACLARGMTVIPVSSIEECVEILCGKKKPAPQAVEPFSEVHGSVLDFADIKGQENAKRAITIAVTGRHALLMIGSPGCGKTMLAKRIPTIMPDMSYDEMLEMTIILSVTGKVDSSLGVIKNRPFRMPHHTIGTAGLLGGGNYPVPGEITLAHNGVLFLDEVCEFNRDTIDSLRIPIEDKVIRHFRNGQLYTFPCDFLLIMAANPCRCGYYGDSDKPCTCTPLQIDSYQQKLSGPLRQRVDLEIKMEKVEFSNIADSGQSVTSSDMRQQVERARSFARSHGRTGFNGDMSDREIEEYCKLTASNEEFMKNAYNKLGLSPRTYKKTLKVARTIADLAESEVIDTNHIAEALSYRKNEGRNGYRSKTA